MAASVALLATACAAKPSSNVDNQPSTTDSSGTGSALTAGTLLVSDGTATVSIGGKAVTFPGPVTDATWSPDGSRIAYIDGDGNVATARPDGTGVFVLTAKDPSVVRSRPSWSRAWLYYAEKKGNTSTLMFVSPNGCAPTGAVDHGSPWDMDTGPGTSYIDVTPSAAFSFKPARVAFQHNEPSGPQVWINDSNQRSPNTYKVANGSEPALSPDGQRLAYIGGSGQLFLTGVTSGGPGIQITFGADHPTRPVWNSDSQSIAYETAKDVESVGVLPGPTSNPVTTLSPKPGVPAFLAAKRNTVARISGVDPVAMSIAVSQARWPAQQAYTPYQGYPGAQDATIATPAQASVATNTFGYGPLLLTSGASLDSRTKAELQRIFGQAGDPNGTPNVTIVGSDVSAAVEQSLKAMGYQVTRKQGAPLPTTPGGACGLQKDAYFYRQTIVIVDQSSANDNAAATAMALSLGAPILRLHGGLDDAAKQFLTRSAATVETVYIVDSTGAVSAEVQKQIGDLVSGPAGYDTPSNPAYAAP
jgi:Tol biopolymer transport system component